MGHAHGLCYLASTEARERFSYCGMTAPPGIAYSSLALSNAVIGAFWALHAAIGAAGGLMVALCGPWFNRALQFPPGRSAGAAAR
jgi:hypothetical protein